LNPFFMDELTQHQNELFYGKNLMTVIQIDYLCPDL